MVGHQKKHWLVSWSTIAYKTEDNYQANMTTEQHKWHKTIAGVQQECRRYLENRLAE